MMKRVLYLLFKDNKGQGLTEYSLILSFVVLAVIGALILVGTALQLYYDIRIVEVFQNLMT